MSQIENYYDDDIVISGISGTFPDSENFEEFKENLLKGKDMFSTVDTYDGSIVKGEVKTIDRFDHSFFHLNHHNAEGMLIGSRILLEKTFEAVLDAGYNLQQIKGKNIAVVGGIWESSSENDPAFDASVEKYDGIIGTAHFMCANRISNWLDLHGPSFVVNTACSSSMYALDMAIKYIQNGQCEGAIVNSANFIFCGGESFTTPVLHSTKTISSPFDAQAGGYIRSDAVVVIFIQKRKYARRVYANIVHLATNCDGFKAEGIMHPSITQQKELYEQFYKTVNIDPRSISYIEAHCTGTQVGDVVEGTSIADFFCQGRETPLKVGSVKSNIGHTEAAAALCSIAKLIVAFESGIIPANSHFTSPNPNIKGLINGQLQVVTEPTPVEGKYFALNSFGIGGANGHLLLTPHNKIKQPTKSHKEGIPWMLTVSGRTEDAIDCIFNDIEKNYHDEEYVALLHQVFSDDISGHLQRGFIILHEKKDHVKSKTFFPGDKRPVWFVFSGMGCQWPAMAKSLMTIPIFSESIRKSHQILQLKQIDLIRIITDDDPKIFDNILNSLVGIAAIQVALVDILQAIGIQPDGIIGHSAGEVGCAYADGCLTAEQTILAAYYRGLVSIETELIHGTMAAVGASYETLKELITNDIDIDIACHNGHTSYTISGPTPNVEQFIQILKEKDIFVKPVNTSNIAYHSRFIEPLGQKLLSLLQNEVITERKLRSEKWICTSAPEHEWDMDQAKYSSAEYFTNNLLKPVLFEEGCRHIPSNAITIEIAPHGLLQAVLKRSLPTTVTNIPLTLKNHENGVEFLLNSLGRMYEAGCVPKLNVLYPPVEFPVSKSTPTIASLIKWQHDEQWSVGKLEKDFRTQREFIIRSTDVEYKFLKDHIIDGRNLYPGLGYLWLVVEMVSRKKHGENSRMPVVFENVRFERATIIPQKGVVKFLVTITPVRKHFEVSENGQILASGTVRLPENVDKEMIDVKQDDVTVSDCDDIYLNTNDFYKELRLRGYQYKGSFKQVARVHYTGTYGEVWWNDNFLTFMDNMAQIQILALDTRELLIPTFMRKIVIDFEKHMQQTELLDKEKPQFPVHVYPRHRLVCSGGIQMIGWSVKGAIRKKNLAEPLLQKYQFVPYINDEEMKLNLAVETCINIALANTLEMQVNTYELLDTDHDPDVEMMSPIILKSLMNSLLGQPNVAILKSSDQMTEIEMPNEITISEEKLPKDKSSTLIALSNICDKIDMLEDIREALKDNGFIITREPIINDINTYEKLNFNVCFSRKINASERIILLNKLVKSESSYKTVKVESDSFTWVPNVQNELAAINLEQNDKLVMYAEKDQKNGILGLFNTLRREQKGINVRCIYVMDENTTDFSLDHPFYTVQLDKNLCENVLKNGQWGAYCYLQIDQVDDTEASNVLCVQKERGNLSSFKWIERSPPHPHENFEPNSIYVYYSSLNFRDIMITSGRISAEDLPLYSRLSDCHHGFEFSGKDNHGTRWMGIIEKEAIATTVQPHHYMTWKIPDYLTLEEGATIPTVYLTVIIAFFFKMNLRRGCSVLIHAGSGGIGQAAINICLHYECEIFTTVGTPEKVQFIRETFPQIPESHIGNSRDTSFEQLIIQQTNGRGVDVVLNSLIGEKMQASVRCLAYAGHFIEIGKYDMLEKQTLNLEHFLNDISFHSIQMDLGDRGDSHLKIALRNKLSELLDQGVVKPLHRTVFQADEVESAYRFMAAGKHIGKVLIKMNNEENELEGKPTSIFRKCEPQVLCQEYSAYVIVGGLGGMGMELVDWLILKGARNIVLSSRTGIKDGYQSYRIQLWRSYGAKIIIFTEDVIKEAGAENLLRAANELGPVEGIFNLGMVLKDGPFVEQTEENFNLAYAPKAVITMHLDNLSRKMCPDLKHFVVFSSVACGLGNPYQSSYSYANSAMERICEIRHRDNLPSLVIQWGAVGDVGTLTEFQEQISGTEITFCGALLQTIKSCLQTLNMFMKQSSHPILSSMVVAEKNRFDGIDIISAVANVLGIKDLKTINQSWTFPELGMDSILGMELKQILESEFNVIFTPEDLRTMTFVKLHQMKEEKETASKTGKKMKTQIQIFMEEVLLNKAIRRIPIDENHIERPIVFDENPTTFIFPGVDGLAVTMQSLAKNLPGQVLCFQYYFAEVADFSVAELRDHFAKYILENFNLNGEFCLIGHSVGGCLALEVAHILEKQGKRGYLYLIECSPEYFQKLQDRDVVKEDYSSDEQIQIKVCSTMVSTFFPTMPIEHYTQSLKNTDSWASKKKLCLKLLSTELENENAMDLLLDKIYFASIALRDCKIPQVSLESSGILIRCVKDPLDADDAYGLSQYFKNPIQIHKIDDAGHNTILNHAKTSEILMESPLWKK
ncbi:fatty acid synthase-like [Planococcus citri]|uniref:fatty acid synthase-like n=1 Tax=Planococcus citri TaxID=170843 RepID=UPI0031F8AC98